MSIPLQVWEGNLQSLFQKRQSNTKYASQQHTRATGYCIHALLAGQRVACARFKEICHVQSRRSHHRRSDRHRPRHRARFRQTGRDRRRLRPPRGRRQGRSRPSSAASAREAAFIFADVRHEDDVRSLVDQTVARFGRLDVAVNNAGTEGKPGSGDRSRRWKAMPRCSTPMCSARCSA